MTIYNDPWTRSVVTFPYVWWDGAFTDEELAKLIEYCEREPLDRAAILGTDPKEEEKVNNVRRSNIKFYNRNPETAWFCDRMNEIGSRLNDQFYGFDLNGYDAFQFTSYDAKEKGTYHWHMDMCMGTDGLPSNMFQPRKLTLVLPLNDDYEGGDFMFNLGDERFPIKADARKGRVIAFPSWVIHSVTQVTKGIRKSAVIWITGPKFR